MVNHRATEILSSEAAETQTSDRISNEANVSLFANSLYQASIAERVEFIRQGVPARRVDDLEDAMCVSRDYVSDLLNLPRTSVRRKIRKDARLSTDQSERVIGLARLIGQVADMLERSGDPKDFDVARWLGEWLELPVPALGGGKPADYMSTLTGQELVSNLIVQAQAGVFA